MIRRYQRVAPSWVKDLLEREGVDLARIVEIEWEDPGPTVWSDYPGVRDGRFRSATAHILIDPENPSVGTKPVTVSEWRP